MKEESVNDLQSVEWKSEGVQPEQGKRIGGEQEEQKKSRRSKKEQEIKKKWKIKTIQEDQKRT